jgi:hypothetical protein
MNGPRYETGIGLERSSPNGPAVGDDATRTLGSGGGTEVMPVRFDRHEHVSSTCAASAGDCGGAVDSTNATTMDPMTTSST